MLPSPEELKNRIRGKLNPYEDLLLSAVLHTLNPMQCIALMMNPDEFVGLMMAIVEGVKHTEDTAELSPTERVIRLNAGEIRREAFAAAFKALEDIHKHAGIIERMAKAARFN